MIHHHGSTLRPRTRGRDIHEEHRVSTPLELLFDLTFVVAIALAASQLHHAEEAGHLLHSLPGYLVAFISIWWAWMNYTWFASAYDNDDTWFRVFTLLQMGGVVVFATGVPALFDGQFFAAIVGYAIMRIALSVQWLRAAYGDPERHRTCMRYTLGIALVQLLWIARYVLLARHWLPASVAWPSLVLLYGWELSVPVWAERAGATPWHAHHIAERYSLFVIILLGECILGTTNAVASMWQAHGASTDLVLVGLGGTLLVFCLWWMYFLLPSADALHRHRERCFGWGYGHFFTFAALGAVGGGLEVIADVLKTSYEEDAASSVHEALETTHGVTPFYALCAVAIPQAIYVFSIWALHRYATRAKDRQSGVMLVCLACIGVGPLAVARGLPLPWGLVLLSLGPILAIAYNERGRKRRAEAFSVR